MSGPVKLTFQAVLTRDGTERRVTCNGRVAWAVLSLMRARLTGCTPIDRPAPRWSDYVFKGRALGFNIETVHEGHDGPFAGHHARYVLHDEVEARGGTLAEYLASPEGRREFPDSSFLRRAA